MKNRRPPRHQTRNEFVAGQRKFIPRNSKRKHPEYVIVDGKIIPWNIYHGSGMEKTNAQKTEPTPQPPAPKPQLNHRG